MAKDTDELDAVDGDSEKRKTAEWENILFDIEKGFEAHQKIVAGEFSSRSHEARAEETMHKGLQLFAKHYFHLWD